MQKIDISSTAIEKGFDIAKGFVEKLIYPSAEEVGLLLKDGIAKWRFANQVKALVKAQSICEKYGVNPQMISPKLLTPLLEYASLEDNEKLQDKWATLLANMVDSDQNVKNHVFPYLLSQVSIQEFELIESTLKLKNERVKDLNFELRELLKTKDDAINEIMPKIKELEAEIEEVTNRNINNPKAYRGTWNLKNSLIELKNRKRRIELKQQRIERSIKQPEQLPANDLRDFEISNLIRLGVVKEIVKSYGYVDSQKVSVTKGSDSHESADFVRLDDISVTIDTEVLVYELTELGELFVMACQEKTITDNK